MNTLPTGENVIAEDEVWDLMGKNTDFRRFVEYCLTRFVSMDVAEEEFPIPDDIEEIYSDRLYVIRDQSNGSVLLSLTGDGYGENFF